MHPFKFSYFLKHLSIITFIVFALVGVSTLSSCKTKDGCGLEKKYAPDMESKGGKSTLFSKKQRKKMK
ncbi:MAG: hypothetical protein R2774_10300 [Saprospiraceae bacterium]